MNKKGFTLIELLVVIAIIGILSSVAIVYLSDARNKANDAKVDSNVTTASTQLELDRAAGSMNDGSVGFVQADDVPLIIAKLGAHPCGGSWSTSIAADMVAFYSTRCSTGGAIFCADSTGYRGVVSTTPTAATGRCQ